jgi:hypothetical protein
VKILGTTLLSIGVAIGAVLFLMLSSCALDRQATAAYRTQYGAFALVDLAAVAFGIWAIAKLNRDQDG